MEVWKTIPGYEGHYKASSFGRIRSNTRRCSTGRGAFRTIKGKILKPFKNCDGYFAVNFTLNGRKQWLIAHLILLTFVGPCPEGMESCHNDGNKINDRPKNLRWDTHFNNIQDRAKHGTVPRGSRVKFSKLTRFDVVKIKLAFAKDNFHGKTKRIAEQFNVNKTTIGDIRAGKSWGWLKIL